MRNIDLGHFERQILIDRVGKALAKAQGWQVDFDDNILESQNPRLRFYAGLASVAIEEIEAFVQEIDEFHER